MDFFKVLASTIEALWETATRPKVLLKAVARSKDTDPVTLQLLQRNCVPFSPRLVQGAKVFYGVRLGHVSRVYTSWKEVQHQTIGIKID